MIHRKTRLQRSAPVLAVSTLATLAALAWAGATSSGQPQPSLEQQFASTVRPFVQSYCSACHSGASPQAQLDLTAYKSMAAVMGDDAHWARVLEKLSAKQMPPPRAGKQPSERQRAAVIAWIRSVRKLDAERNAGDPGFVPARRLSNAEYDYTIRDLTGVDLQPARQFPVDPADQEGFDNSSESLTLSPALLKKYADAAKGIADHVVLTSRGLEFATHPVIVETDRDKFCILRIVAFYQRQPTNLADYFQAAWRYRYRAALGAPGVTLATVAAAAKVSPRYLETVWSTLTAPGEKVGPIAKLQAMWNALPAPEKALGARASRPPEKVGRTPALPAASAGCVAMRDWVLAVRKKLAWQFDNLRLPRGFAPGGQCFVLWKDREYATHRRSFDPENLQVGGVPRTRVVPSRRRRFRGQTPQTVTDPVNPDLFVPKEPAARAPYLAAFTRFCSVFPDAFYIAERGLMADGYNVEPNRLLSAGFHNQMGYFRDDQPLMELVLDENGRQELDSLWKDFDMVAFIPERMHREFFHYERAESGTITGPEFNFAQAEDPDITSDAKIQRFATVYLAKARKSLQESGGDPVALQAIQDHFLRVTANIHAAERERLAAEPLHLKALLDFAQRAYRRPLASSERADILGFYRSLRQKENLSHEDAVRDTLASILLSPDFLYRLDLAGDPDAPQPAAGVRSIAAGSKAAPRPAASSGLQPLSDTALASRLSYFLWSSMPDGELLAHAAAGDLHRPEVLVAQARRMLRDARVRDMAVEFGGNWLDFRRFEEQNTVDRSRFPSFDDKLREAMFEEPVRFLTDEFQHDGSVLDMVYGKYTFVNSALARHYGMTGVKPAGDDWVRVAHADRYGRGGLLPMAVFLTHNSPGLRTSPVKRGFWVVHRLLGETIPPPPPTVPQLPQDESKLGDRTLRQVLEQHRSNPACAGCHARFDSYGLVFEEYGPVGEARTRDLGGKAVDASAPFPGGERTGVAGLETFIRQQRQNDFLSNLGRKLLSYALGRSLQPSDEPLMMHMQHRLAADGYRFDSLVESIVTSPQFRYRRAPAAIARR